ncbi:MAG TPA: hypothetical protein VFL27_14070 [Candidatus Dormibacteraeota bacterium]|nr:hypothetical protein [Candidatus Dormibacteraeota bacterium]
MATQSSALAAPALEPMYANDRTVFMAAPPQAAGEADPNVAQDFYLIAYPVLPINGRQPLCNFSCPGPSNRPPVRDVVLNGAPGFGLDGTAGAFNPNWHVLLLVYKTAWVVSPNFAPARSAAEVDAGEAAGHFLPIASGDNPYERDTGIVFLCVLVSSHA